MKKADADISTIFIDARGSTARPFCCRVGFPKKPGTVGPKFRTVLICRAGSPEDAKAIRTQLIALRRKAKTAADFTVQIQRIQAAGHALQADINRQNYETKKAANA